jgi:hypothetical protein
MGYNFINPLMPNLDIHAAVVTAFALALIGAFFAIILGINSIRAGARLQFFRKRRDRMVRGWRMLLTASALIVIAFFLNRYAEPVVYQLYPPTTTVTLTPTITLTPTMTLTVTVSVTPTITNTPSVTNTPSLPVSVLTGFQTTVTPAPDAVFSPIQFAQKLDAKNLPVNPAASFDNPVGHLYGSFSFDKMRDGAQFTALWYRGSDLVYFESFPWKGGTGGYGYTDWNPKPEEWLPGDYTVQIFVGMAWKQTGRFTVTAVTGTQGPKGTPTTTPTATRTKVLSPTPPPTKTKAAP